MRHPRAVSTSLILSAALFAGCASDQAAQATPTLEEALAKGPRKATSREGDLIVERFTLDDDDSPDVIKFFEEFTDPDDDDLTLRRLRKKHIDVNSDGNIDIQRAYDEAGELRNEAIDVDLDTTFDVRNYFDLGQLVRKELLTDDGSAVAETRFYKDGAVERVERDRNQDGQIDYWEFYEQGTLDRIGRDLNGDGTADKWTRR